MRLALLLLLAGCARVEPVEKPLVDLSTLGQPAKPKKAARLEAGNPFKRLFEAPASAADRPAWLERLQAAREADRLVLKSEGAPGVYEDPALAWTQNSFVEVPLPVQDRFFYDAEVRRYTVERFVDDLTIRYGGADTVVLSFAYPNLGVDERNQFDLLRDLPGGLPALHRVIEAFHRRGVHVLLAFHPWDQGTRFEGLGFPAAIARAVHESGADGFFGDTMVAPEREFLLAAQGAPYAIEPEAGMGDSAEALLWNPMGWADWREYREAPGVDRYRWAERRFRTHVGAREAHSHLDDLQYAWLNGAGFLAWENVAGLWNGLVPRDAEILRRMRMIYRALPGFPNSPGWSPYEPGPQPEGVYVSKWPLPDSGAVWTIVNRTKHAVRGPVLEVPRYLGQRFYDLWTGEELHPREKLINRFQHVSLVDVPLEPRGFGAVVETNEAPRLSSPLYPLLPALRARARLVPAVGALEADWSFAPQRVVAIAPTPKYSAPPAGMVFVPGIKGWMFAVRGTEVEDYEGVDVQYPWETHPQLVHEARRDIAPFYLDRTPVTNREFKKFLDQREFRPADPHNFLRDWPEGKLTSALADKPVTWVSIEEARLFCRAIGKRLPHEWEWQYAAQGKDRRPYPWGRDWDQSRVPVVHAERERRPGPDVGSYPSGASPFGALDMVGLVWQWTDEFFDEHTRAAVLKGGSYYQPAGSPLYLPSAPDEAEHPERRGHHQLDTHGKYLLMDPSLDRAGTIGFRCAADAP